MLAGAALTGVSLGRRAYSCFFWDFSSFFLAFSKARLDISLGASMAAVIAWGEVGRKCSVEMSRKCLSAPAPPSSRLPVRHSQTSLCTSSCVLHILQDRIYAGRIQTTSAAPKWQISNLEKDFCKQKDFIWSKSQSCAILHALPGNLVGSPPTPPVFPTLAFQ